MIRNSGQPFLVAAWSGFLLVVLALPGRAQQGPSVSVDVSAGRHRIDNYIYGMASYGLDASLQAKAAIPVLRWGGDGTTRYNWQVDSSNAGFDWFFTGGSGATNPKPSAGPDALVTADQATHSQTLMTIPIIPWINSTSNWNCSFPVSIYGQQQATNPYIHPNGDYCGNSLRPDNSQIPDTNIPYNHIANAPSIQQAWVNHLVGKFGAANHGGVMFYQLDNEPYGWGNTHRDVMPGTTTYATIATLGAQYATAIKSADPSAKVLGPSDFTLGGWLGDQSTQNGLFAGQYYLQAMAASSAAAHRRLLDYFDEHYYFDTSSVQNQLASTRTLWDPTFNGGTWIETYYFHGPMMMVPRFKQWIAQYYPGTQLAVSEYSIDSGHKLVTDAVAQADVLGIFGREGVGLASLWGPPAATDPIAFGFLLFRNYDGQGSRFGPTGVSTTSADQTKVSAYGAEAATATGYVLTLVLINKTPNALTVPVSVDNPAPSGNAALFSYTSADLHAIHNNGPVTFANGVASVALPGYSMHMLVVPLQ